MIGPFSVVHALLLLAAEVAPTTTWVHPEAVSEQINGVWRAQGYGRLLVLRSGKITFYHEAGPYCYRDPNPEAASDGSLRLVTVVSPDRIAFAENPEQTRYVFDRIAALPAACLTKRSWTPAEIGRLVAATFANLYPGFGHRGRTPGKLSAAIGTLPPDADDVALYDRLAPALLALDDAHVGLEATIDGEGRSVESGEAPSLITARQDAALSDDPAARERTWSHQYRDGIVALLDGGGHQVANRRILWGRIGRVGYINIVTMGAFSSKSASDGTAELDAALDDALTAFQGLPGVIVDVTNNRGGYDVISLRIAGRFADRRRLAFEKQAIGAKVPFQPFHVDPSASVRYLGPVTLLTSDVTVSAGETFTLAMRALPNVRHAGRRTRGALSDQLAKPLPNGWILTLPAETYRATDGHMYEGVGITPNFTTKNIERNHAAAVVQLAKCMETDR